MTATWFHEIPIGFDKTTMEDNGARAQNYLQFYTQRQQTVSFIKYNIKIQTGECIAYTFTFEIFEKARQEERQKINKLQSSEARMSAAQSTENRKPQKLRKHR